MDESPGSYEYLLSASLALFLRSLELVAEASQHSLAHPAARRGLKQAIAAMHTCGTALQRLPLPPAGAEEADRSIRAFGVEVVRYTGDLRALAFGRNSAEAVTVGAVFQRRSEELTQAFREVARTLETGSTPLRLWKKTGAPAESFPGA